MCAQVKLIVLEMYLLCVCAFHNFPPVDVKNSPFIKYYSIEMAVFFSSFSISHYLHTHSIEWHKMKNGVLS